MNVYLDVRDSTGSTTEPIEPLALVRSSVMASAVALSCLVVVMKLADEIGATPFVGVAIVSMVVCLAILWCWRPAAPRRPCPADLLAPAGLSIGAVGVWARAVQRNLEIPVVFSVDPARHIAMTAWILDRRQLIHGVDPLLDSLSNYPPGGHIIAAFLSWTTGATALTSTWLVALGSVALTLAGAACLAGELADAVTPHAARKVGRAPLAGLATVCLGLVAWHFTIGMVTYEFFFSQSVGLALLTGGVLAAVMGVRSGLAWWRWLPAAVVTAIASFLCYPQQALVVPVVVVVGLFWMHGSQRSTWSPKVVGGALGVLAIVGVAGIVAVKRAGYLSTNAAFGTGEGAVTTLRLGRIGGWPTVVLVAGGVILITGAVRRRVPGASVLLTALAVPVVMTLVLWAMRRGIILRAPVTNYRIAKNVFTAVPFAAAVGGIAVAAAIRSRTMVSALTIGALMLTAFIPLQPRTMNATRAPLVSHDGYALARWVAQHYDVTDVGLAGRELEPFTLWYIGLRRPVVSGADIAMLVPRSTRWEAWPAGDRPEHYLLVTGPRFIEIYSARPGVTLVRRQGTAALLERR